MFVISALNNEELLLKYAMEELLSSYGIVVTLDTYPIKNLYRFINQYKINPILLSSYIIEYVLYKEKTVAYAIKLLYKICNNKNELHRMYLLRENYLTKFNKPANYYCSCGNTLVRLLYMYFSHISIQYSIQDLNFRLQEVLDRLIYTHVIKDDTEVSREALIGILIKTQGCISLDPRWCLDSSIYNYLLTSHITPQMLYGTNNTDSVVHSSFKKHLTAIKELLT